MEILKEEENAPLVEVLIEEEEEEFVLRVYSTGY